MMFWRETMSIGDDTSRGRRSGKKKKMKRGG
jgi:hypothetical protein